MLDPNNLSDSESEEVPSIGRKRDRKESCEEASD